MSETTPYPNDKRLPTRARRDADVPSWTPGVTYDENGGELRTRPRQALVAGLGAPVDPPDDAELLTEFDLDPATWTVTGVTRSKWQTAAGEWREAFKARFKRRGSGAAFAPAEVDEILTQYANVRRHRTRARAAKRARKTLMVPVGDLQLGKPDGGGTAATAERFAYLTRQVHEMIVDNGGVERLVLPWLGDCIEGLVSQGGRNVARLDIPVTEQVRLYRRLMLHQIATLAPWAEHVLMPVVPGNHDETYRQQSQPITDSWAIEGASAVADALAMTDHYQHIEFVFPEEEEAAITVDVGGLTLGFTHGHLFGSSPNGAVKWWQQQSHGRQLVGQADILVSAHWHHLRVEHNGGGRMWIQIPALDGGSDWYRRTRGDDIPAGMLSVWLTPGEGAGWTDLKVHQ